jgi:hypothetical protein
MTPGSVARARVLLGPLFALGLISACSATPTDPAYDLGVSNQTTLTVTLVVNGAVIRTVQPHTQEIVSTTDLPALPWSVETRTASGRALSGMTVRAGDVSMTNLPGGARGMKGDAVRVDLSCGRLDMWSGPPLLGPVPGPGRPGDCDP